MLNKASVRTYVVLSTVLATLVGGTALAGATVDSDVVDAATTAGTDLKDTAIAVILVLIPMAIAVFLTAKVISWAKRFVRA